MDENDTRVCHVLQRNDPDNAGGHLYFKEWSGDPEKPGPRTTDRIEHAAGLVASHEIVRRFRDILNKAQDDHGNPWTMIVPHDPGVIEKKSELHPVGGDAEAA